MISLKNVKKTYPNGLTVMENMNIDIQDGSFTVLVGPSGCGKTTMIRMIAGLEEVTEGEIWIDDHDVTRVDPGERGIAMVFQNYALYSHMTVAKNISFGLKNYGYGKEEAKKITDEVLELVGHPVGGVCPFGCKEGIPVYLDVSLQRFEMVFPAVGSPSSAIELNLDELYKYSNALEWIDVCKLPAPAEA